MVILNKKQAKLLTNQQEKVKNNYLSKELTNQKGKMTIFKKRRERHAL